MTDLAQLIHICSSLIIEFSYSRNNHTMHTIIIQSGNIILTLGNYYYYPAHLQQPKPGSGE